MTLNIFEFPNDKIMFDRRNLTAEIIIDRIIGEKTGLEHGKYDVDYALTACSECMSHHDLVHTLI